MIIGRGVVDGEIAFAGVCSEGEWDLIYFALGEYAKNLHATLRRPDTGAEDLEFCEEQLARIDSMEWTMELNNRIHRDTRW